MSDDFKRGSSAANDLGVRGKSLVTDRTAPGMTPDPGKSTITAGALPRTTHEFIALRSNVAPIAGVSPPATPELAPAHSAAPSRVAEKDNEQALNAIIKVVAYDAGGKVIARWGARAHWDGRLPVTFHGRHGRAWTWSDPAGRETRLQTNQDGTGGISIEAWAQRVGADSVDVFAQPVDAVTLHPGAHKDNHAPGHAIDARGAGGGSSETSGAG